MTLSVVSGRQSVVNPRKRTSRRTSASHPVPLPQERTPRTLCAPCALEPRAGRNIEHPTSNAEHRIVRRLGRSVFDVGCSMFFLGFMGSPHDILVAHWDHEPADRAVASWSAVLLHRFLAWAMERVLPHWRKRALPKSAGAPAQSKTCRNYEALWDPRKRIGVRQSSGAFGRLATPAKAPEHWRTPKPGGASDGSWKANTSKDWT